MHFHVFIDNIHLCNGFEYIILLLQFDLHPALHNLKP